MTRITRRQFAATTACAVAGASLGLKKAFAQESYPTRPIQLICPWGAGGGTDATARIVAALLERDFGQPVSVVNRIGGSGVVGHSAIATAAPDGYTLGIITVEIAMMHWQGLTDLTPRSYTPLALMNEDPPGIQVKSDSPYKTVKELADAIKAAPTGKFKASGTGQGGIWHLALIGWLTAMGLKAGHVPWVPSNGAAPAMQDLAAGGIDIVTCSVPEARAMIEAGKARSLAIMAQARNPQFPDVPTLRGGDGHQLRYRRLARLCRPERAAAADCHEAHGGAEESLRLERVQGLHVVARLRRDLGRRRPLCGIHGRE
jgi:tripartite-type tricarboxylate transporter receptor subunit TctC